jgi:hypothetical protein
MQTNSMIRSLETVSPGQLKIRNETMKHINKTIEKSDILSK